MCEGKGNNNQAFFKKKKIYSYKMSPFIVYSEGIPRGSIKTDKYSQTVIKQCTV